MSHYLLEYRNLIENARAFFEIQHGVTHNKEHDFKQTIVIEHSSYNGYNNIKRFKAKLKSLSILLELDIEQILERQKLSNLHIDDTIIMVLLELESLFNIADNQITHKNFVLEQPNTTRVNIDQSYFEEYIKIAYESIKNLNLEHVVRGKFEKLFIGHPNEQTDNITRVEKALHDLKIVDKNGASILTIRGKAILWALITFLKIKKIIKEESEEVYINIFWKLIKGNGKAPIKPHRDTNAYERAEKTIIGYFSKIGLTTINDKT